MTWQIPLLAGGVVFLLVVGLVGFLGRSVLEERLQRLERKSLGRRMSQLAERIGRALYDIPLVGELVDRKTVERYLNWAGWRISAWGFLGVSAGLGAVVGMAGIVAALNGLIAPSMVPFLVLMVSLAPWAILKQKNNQARKNLEWDFLNFLERTSVGVATGLPLIRVLEWAAPSNAPVLAYEVRVMLEEVAGNSPLWEALDRFAERLDLMVASEFVVAVKHAEKYGTPYEDVLLQIIGDQRKWRELRIEELARKMETKILFPMVLSVMPAVVLILIGPLAIIAFEVLIGR